MCCLVAIEFLPHVMRASASLTAPIYAFQDNHLPARLQGLAWDVAPTYATEIRTVCPKICVFEWASAAPTYAFLHAPQLVLTLAHTSVMKRGTGFLLRARRRVRRPNLCVAGAELFAPRYA